MARKNLVPAQPPTHHTLTRTRHQCAAGAAPHEPETLDTYVDGADGEMWTGGYLRHQIGDSQLVPAHVARVVMGDPGLRLHYACEPPIALSDVQQIEESHDASLTPTE
jgi:hypothetical protein